MENRDNIDVIVGPASSGVSVPLSIVTEIHSTPIVSHWATSPQLSEPFFDHFLRTIPSDDVTAFALAKLFKEMKLTHVAILHTISTFGESWRNALQTHCEVLDISVSSFPMASNSEVAMVCYIILY